jgi:hypothetical protein
MKRLAALIGSSLLVLSPTVFAQTPHSTEGLETCFRQSRIADGLCEQQTNAGLRWDCFKKTRDAELECLTHIPRGQPLAATPPHQDVTPPPAAASDASPDNPPKNTGSIEQPSPAHDAGSGGNSSSANANPDDAPHVPGGGGEATLHVQPDAQTLEKASVPQANRWIVSETTSPIDYSPVMSAVKHIELSLQFLANSAWRNQQRIYFQTEDQPPYQTDWNWSADGKTATLRNDPVLLLQAVPDGSIVKIWASDRTPQSTAFQFVGFDGIKKKVAAACNWAPQQAQTSPRNRATRAYGRR